MQRHFKGEINIAYYSAPGDVRLVNKIEEPLSFIIWTDQPDTKEKGEKQEDELKYFKELAKNCINEKRE